MKKKIICITLAVVMSVFACYFVGTIVVKADEMPSIETIFNATNTYNLNGSVTKETSFEKYHEEKGYDNPQYEFNFDMSSKNNNQTTSFPYVTVFTHGYNSSASDWMNNTEYIDNGSKFDITYNEHSIVNKVVEPYVIGAESFWSLSAITWS